MKERITVKNIEVKPFLKWAGGKNQLLDEISKKLPSNLGIKIKKYAEPFIGGGALLFYVLSNYEVEDIYISDINKDLINTYKVIKNDITNLIKELKKLQNEYMNCDEDDKKQYYNTKRNRYNDIGVDENSLEKASLFIFLNRTCFNGLYRVNKKGKFNVPMGKYTNPLICDENNLKKISQKLEKVRIVEGNYEKSMEFIDENTFVYFDPLYRPLTKSSSFTSYTEYGFDDKKQIELAKYFEDLDKIGAKVMLSNSDPKNTDINDNFFDELYSSYNIYRIMARRNINSKGNSRGKINEILITNYGGEE